MCADRVTRHILVVDDYPDVAEMMAMLLADVSLMSITTDIGLDGEQALRLATGRPPAVAVLDIDMPTMDGLQAARRIRAALAHNPPRLIAVTGNYRHALAPEMLEAFDRVLLKPVDIDILLRLIEQD